MAIAAEELAGAAEGGEGAASAGRSSSGQDWLNTGRGLAQRGGAAYQRVSSPGASAQTITRLIWAIALGLIALEIVSEATGQYWQFRLPGFGSWTKKPYAPLYQGQQIQQPASSSAPSAGIQPAPSPFAPMFAMPGFFGGSQGVSAVAGWHGQTLAGGV